MLLQIQTPASAPSTKPATSPRSDSVVLLSPEAPPDAQYGQVSARKREKISAGLARRLVLYPGRLLVVIGAKTDDDLTRLYEVLEDEPVIDLSVVVWWEGTLPPRLPANPAITVELRQGGASEALTWLVEAGAPPASSPEQWSVRTGKRGSVNLSSKDVSYITDRFRLLTESDLSPPSRFSLDDLRAFLSGDINVWSGYAAGLVVTRDHPPPPDLSLEEEVRSRLKSVAAGNARNCIVIDVPAQGGAGLTTLFRATAFRMASEGFPTIILRPNVGAVDTEELLAFTGALNESITRATGTATPLLIVTDVEHDRIGLERILPQLLTAHARPAVLLRGTRAKEGELEKPTFNDRRTRLRLLTGHTTETEVLSCQATFSAAAARW